MTLEISNDYIKFSEPETSKAIDARLQPTLVTDTAQNSMENVKGIVNLSPNSATLLDTVYGVLPGLSVYNKDFLTVENYHQETVSLPESDAPDFAETFRFGFTYVLARSPRHYLLERDVYTILDFLGDIGGFYGAMDMLS